jgi:MFS family permease
MLVERAGRRPLLMIGVACMTIAMTLLTYLFLTHATGVVVLVVVLAYIAAYCSSIACLTWVILSEIFPNRIRGGAMSVSVVALWLGNFLLSQTFPLMYERLGLAQCFWIYAAICFAGFLYIFLRLPETKGKTLEQIERDLVD